MGYVLADKHHLLDLSTFKFVKIEPSLSYVDVSVPFYFWTYFNNIGQRFGTDERAYTVDLNELQVEFMRGFKESGVPFKSFFENYQHVLVRFKDRGKETVIDVVYSPSFVVSHTDLDMTDYYYLKDVGYNIKIGDFTKKYFTQFYRPSLGNPRFRTILSLQKCNLSINSVDAFHFGINRHKFRASFKGNMMRYRYYAFLLGTWAILLTDDMKFAALAILDRVTDLTLSVNQFIYAADTYIVKLMTLSR